MYSFFMISKLEEIVTTFEELLSPHRAFVPEVPLFTGDARGWFGLCI